jgi:hypothetical protein
MSRAIDLIGKRYGRLTVIARAGSKVMGIKKPRKTPCWKCQCDCGKQTIATSDNLRNGNTRSCGCLSRESRSNLLKYDSRMKHIQDLLDDNGHIKPEFEKNWHPTASKTKRITNTSGVTGVSCQVDKNQILWIAKLYYHGKYVLNRSFKTKAEAVQARLDAEKKYLSKFIEK